LRAASPLRYPGGKWRLTAFFQRLIEINDLTGCEYIEPYAGGASLALSLLFSGSVSSIRLNDLDPAIYSFWWAVLNRPEPLLKRLRDTPISVREWKRQRQIYAAGMREGRESLGFATFYLNRTNHSGILNGGVIGGQRQTGDYAIDARFNKTELARRIEVIARHAASISVTRMDALAFVRRGAFARNSLIYFDPPYFDRGPTLYMNAYTKEDHAKVAKAILRRRARWVVSYDDVTAIKRLYGSRRMRTLALLHTARSSHVGAEVVFFSDDLRIPRLRSPALNSSNAA